MLAYLVRNSWNGDIVQVFAKKEDAQKLRDELNAESRNSKTPKFMGNTPYRQSYFLDEWEIKKGAHSSMPGNSSTTYKNISVVMRKERSKVESETTDN